MQRKSKEIRVLKSVLSIALASLTFVACGDVQATSSPAAADQTKLRCRSADGVSQITVVESAHGQLSLQVSDRGKLLTSKTVALKVLPDRQVYESAKFKNIKNAPSQLYLQVYKEDSKTLGEFSEISFLPVLKRLDNLTCTNH